MPTDTLTCQVTPDSVEPTSLSCSMPPLEALDLWTTIGSVGTMAATVLLAIFAFAAWRSAQSTLKTMERQMEDNRETAQNAIDASTLLATESRQRALLADYCTALTNLGLNRMLRQLGALEESDDFMARNLSTVTAWVSWAMELHGSDPEFRSHTFTWDESIRMEMMRDHMKQSGIETTKSKSLLTPLGQTEGANSLAGIYLNHLQIWQVNPTHRHEVVKKLARLKEEYIA